MLVVPAYAKVNLALEVTGRRADGWHDVATVITTIDWHDLIGVSFERAASDPTVELRVTGRFAEGVPDDGTNLAARAAAELLRLAGQPSLAMRIWLDKAVPSAAGLGGGSADAAAVLRAGRDLLARQGIDLDPEDLHAAAARLGSDVPAVLAGGTLLATGRGEVITPLPSATRYLAVAVAGPSETAAAYAALRDDERVATGRATRLAGAITSGALRDDERVATDRATRLSGAITSCQHFDEALAGSALEAPACRAAPGLAEALERLRRLTPANAWHLTGSGGAAFAIAPDPATAGTLAAAARAAGFPARACRAGLTP